MRPVTLKYVAVALLWLGLPGCVAAHYALENVHVVPMDSEIVIYDQAVIVEGDRIVGIIPMEEYVPPDRAERIDGGGGYLMPGLVDAHVHLETYMDARPEFGDAPVFLRHGITSVFNLRGFPEHLVLRDRIARGEIVAPTLYTSGEFVNEPRVNDPAEAANEVRAQARAGYDMIKFREVVDHDVGVLTTDGVDLETFRAIWRSASDRDLPVIGHAPHALGLDAVLESPLTLAHMGELIQLELMPRAPPAGVPIYLAMLVALAAAALVGFTWRLFGGRRHSVQAAALARSGLLPLLLLSAAAVLAVMLLPGGAEFGNRILISALGLFLSIALLQGLLTVIAARRRTPDSSLGWRASLMATGLCAGVAGSIGLVQALPIALHGTVGHLDSVAARIADSGNHVGTTLIIYDEVIALRDGAVTRIPADAADKLDPELRRRFAAAREHFARPLPWSERLTIPGLAVRYDDLAQALAAALNQAGVPLLAGTDAYGVPLIPPGRSLHAELESLVDAGLTPYDALRAATLEPARFLGLELDFGSLEPGLRADLVLLAENPLHDIRALGEPLGVMLRGQWLSREALDDLVEALP
jgi:cytosine/adenosine deaminase-related metal-dependent hydrolase